MFNQTRRDLLSTAGLLAMASATSAWPLAARADDYPSHAVKLIVPFAPGGPTDAVARISSAPIPGYWGQAIIVENHGGAGGIVGADYVHRSAPDGYTLLLTAIHYAVGPSLYKKLPYNFEKDFAPVTLAAVYPTILCVTQQLPVHSVAELITYAKQHPHALSFGSSGNGGGTHLAGEMFKHMAGVDMVHVPYNGSGPAMVDLIGGQVQLMFSDAPTAVAQIKAGKVRAIAVGGERRSALFPDLPTIAESGLPGYAADTWAGISVPAGTPRPVIDALNKQFVRSLRDPRIQQEMLNIGGEASPSTPEEFGKKIHDETVKWAEVIKAAGIQLEG